MGEKLATGWDRKAEAQALFKGTELLGHDGIKEIVVEADTSDGTGWSLSWPRWEEGGGSDAWARAVSGRRELARVTAGRPAGPAKLGFGPSGEERESSGPGRKRKG